MMRGMIIPIDGGGGSFTFQYNPHEIHGDYSAQWVPLTVAGREIPYQQYSHGEDNILEFQLRFASQGEPGFVKGMLEQLQGLMKPTVTMGRLKRPPILQVILGMDIRDRFVLRGIRTRKHTWANEGLLWYYGDAALTLAKYAG